MRNAIYRLWSWERCDNILLLVHYKLKYLLINWTDCDEPKTKTNILRTFYCNENHHYFITASNLCYASITRGCSNICEWGTTCQNSETTVITCLVFSPSTLGRLPVKQTYRLVFPRATYNNYITRLKASTNWLYSYEAIYYKKGIKRSNVAIIITVTTGT